jgi:hypothetical protein
VPSVVVVVVKDRLHPIKNLFFFCSNAIATDPNVSHNIYDQPSISMDVELRKNKKRFRYIGRGEYKIGLVSTAGHVQLVHLCLKVVPVISPCQPATQDTPYSTFWDLDWYKSIQFGCSTGSWEKEFRLVSGREIVAPENTGRKRPPTAEHMDFLLVLIFPFYLKNKKVGKYWEPERKKKVKLRDPLIFV